MDIRTGLTAGLEWTLSKSPGERPIDATAKDPNEPRPFYTFDLDSLACISWISRPGLDAKRVRLALGISRSVRYASSTAVVPSPLRTGTLGVSNYSSAEVGTKYNQKTVYGCWLWAHIEFDTRIDDLRNLRIDGEKWSL